MTTVKTINVPQDALEHPWMHLWEESKCDEHGIWWEYDIVGLTGPLSESGFSRIACGCLRYFRPATPANCAAATQSLTNRDKAKFFDDCVKYGIDLSVLRDSQGPRQEA